MLFRSYRGAEKEVMVSKLANLEVMPQENDEFNEGEEFKGALVRVIDQGYRQYKDDLLMQKIDK